MNVKVFPFNPLQENTYLIWDETGEAAVIDAGMLFDKEMLAGFISCMIFIALCYLSYYLFYTQKD